MNYAQRQYFIQILSKYRLGTATTEEIKFLETYYNTFELNEDLITSENEDDYLFLKEQIKDIIDVQIGPYQKKSIDMVARPMWQKYLAAASVLIFLSIAAFFFVPKSAKKQMAANAYKGIVPGGNKAMLTLASGKKSFWMVQLKARLPNKPVYALPKRPTGRLFTTYWPTIKIPQPGYKIQLQHQEAGNIK